MAKFGVAIYGISLYGVNTDTVATEPSISHQFNVSQIITNVIPSQKNVWNQFDEFGLLASLKRNSGETNWSYKRRIHDAFTNLANSSYRGIVNGVTRELGLSLFQPLTINPKTDNSGNFLAPDPYIRFDGAYLYLYSDYANGELDWVIDRFEPGGNYEHLTRLVDFINTTAFFEASIINSADPYTRSMTIINQSNRLNIDNEPIKASTKFKLDYPYVVRDSLVINDRGTFKTKMDSADNVVRAGQWHIDYSTGVITVGSVPDSSVTISYQATVYPFSPIASPVIVHDINNDNFKTKMFAQVLQDDGTKAHGIPRELGVDIINEILSVKPMYWGV